MAVVNTGSGNRATLQKRMEGNKGQSCNIKRYVASMLKLTEQIKKFCDFKVLSLSDEFC
jgi:hypothetical protein